MRTPVLWLQGGDTGDEQQGQDEPWAVGRTVFPDVLSCASVGSTLTCHLLHNRKHALLCSLVAAEPLHVLRVPAKDEDLVVHACGLASAKCVVSSVDARPAQQLVVGLGAGEVDG